MHSIGRQKSSASSSSSSSFNLLNRVQENDTVINNYNEQDNKARVALTAALHISKSYIIKNAI